MNSEQNPDDSLSADKAAEEIQKVCAALSAEIEDLKKEIQQLREKKVLFESLLGECIRHHYYDEAMEAACSPFLAGTSTEGDGSNQLIKH